MAATAPRRFLAHYFRLTASTLLGVIAINAIVDPLWVYHAPWLPQELVKDHRQANPGLARFSSYDSVVIGNSLTENLLVSEIQANFGWHPIKLCISGSTAREQHLMLDQALATGQVRDVLWGVDFFAFDFEPDAVRTTDFPFHLYARDAATPLKYLVSASTLMNSFNVLLGGGVKDRESRFLWHHKMKFGTESAVNAWQDIVASHDRQGKSEKPALRSAEKHLFEVIQSHPEVRFHVFIPPYSVLYGALQMLAPGDQFSARMRFKRQVARTLLCFPNVEMYDFESAEQVTHDLENYADLVHFNLATSSAILRWMAEGRYRLEFETIDDRIRELEVRTYAYAVKVFSRDSPLRGPLQIDATGLILPTTIVSAIPEAIPTPRRLAAAESPSRN